MENAIAQIVVALIPYLYKFFTEKRTPKMHKAIKKFEWDSIEKAAQLEAIRQKRLKEK